MVRKCIIERLQCSTLSLISTFLSHRVEILGFQSSVKTHYGRHFLSKEMGNDGIDSERRKIFMRRQVGAEAQNYMIKPTDCLVSGAHGDSSYKTAIKFFAGSDRVHDKDWWISFQRKWLPETMEVCIIFNIFLFQYLVNRFESHFVFLGTRSCVGFL